MDYFPLSAFLKKGKKTGEIVPRLSPLEEG
jgi:hypothetical protein